MSSIKYVQVINTGEHGEIMETCRTSGYYIVKSLWWHDTFKIHKTDIESLPTNLQIKIEADRQQIPQSWRTTYRGLNEMAITLAAQFITNQQIQSEILRCRTRTSLHKLYINTRYIWMTEKQKSNIKEHQPFSRILYAISRHLQALRVYPNRYICWYKREDWLSKAQKEISKRLKETTVEPQVDCWWIGETHEVTSSFDKALDENNKGAKVLKKFGWKYGTSLVEGSIREPIRHIRWSGRSGLGSDKNSCQPWAPTVLFVSAGYEH